MGGSNLTEDDPFGVAAIPVKSIQRWVFVISPLSMNPHTFSPALIKVAFEASFVILQRAAGTLPAR